jgi:hypothetical protein
MVVQNFTRIAGTTFYSHFNIHLYYYVCSPHWFDYLYRFLANMACINCQENRGRLTCLGKKGFLTILASAIAKCDAKFSNLHVDGNHCIHEQCRRGYLKPASEMTSKSEVNVLMLMVDEAEKLFDWEVECFLCGKFLKMKDKRGKMKKVIQVSGGKMKDESMKDKILSICGTRFDRD